MKRNIVIAVVAAAALIGGGTATALAVTGGGGDAPQGTSTDVTADVTAADAIASALRHTPGTAVSAELDDDRGAVAWEVDVLAGDGTWHSVRVDTGSAEVLGSHTEREDDTAEVRAALKGASTSAAEAAEAAGAKGTVTSVDLDDDAWEVETSAPGKAEQDWRVYLRTGAVTADRTDD